MILTCRSATPPSAPRPDQVDVRGLHVAVDDALRVGVVEGGQDAVHDVELLVERLQQVTVDRGPEIGAHQELHRHVEEPVLLAEIVYGDDVGVVEEGRRLRLAPEAIEGLVAGGRVHGEGLQGDEAPEDGVLGLVDLAHRALAELTDDPVLADPLAVHSVKAGHARCTRAGSGRHVSTRDPADLDDARIPLDPRPRETRSQTTLDVPAMRSRGHGRPREGRADRELPAAVPRARAGPHPPAPRDPRAPSSISDDHPTADRVHAALARRRVRVSRATVFRTLESFARLGVITKTCHPGSSVRYDSRTDRHHHLVCLSCDRVIDISDARLDALPVPDTRRFGFVVSDFKVQLRGICKQCREQEDKT